MPTLADILDLDPSEVPKQPAPTRPYKGPASFSSTKEARIEMLRLQHHPDAPKTYQEACKTCQPREIEWMGLVLAGEEHAAAATQVFGLRGRSAVNRGSMLATRTPRVMVAMDLGRQELAARVEYTVDEAMRRLDAMIDQAKTKGQMGAAVRAEQLKMELAGHLKDKDKSKDSGFRIIIQQTGQPAPE